MDILESLRMGKEMEQENAEEEDDVDHQGSGG